MYFLSMESSQRTAAGDSRLKRLQVFDAEADSIQTYSGSKVSELPEFQGETVVVYDAVDALSTLQQAGITVKKFEDVKLMERLTDGFQVDKRLFTPIDQHYYPYAVEQSGKGSSGINVHLLQSSYQQLEECRSSPGYQREKKAISAIVEMQRAGIGFDYDAWHEALAPKWEQLQHLQAQRKEHPWNPNREEQEQRLAQYLHVYDTGVKRAWLQGRLYSRWDSFASKSGRMTARAPNLQAMPKSSRPYFRAEEGNLLVFADYSQIELRVLAELTKDPSLLEVFEQNGDVHRQTAVRLFGKDAEVISEEERQIAKTLNFGMVYGITEYGIQQTLQKQQISLTLEEAEQLRQEFLTVFPGIQRFQEMMTCATKVRSLGGRLFDVQELRSTQKMNLPVQATAAEGLKETLAILHQKRQCGWKLVAAVHDELIIEVPCNEAETAKEVMVYSMKEGMQHLLKTVPIVVEATISVAWDTAININNTNNTQIER